MSNSAPFYQPGRYLCEIVDQGLTNAKTGTLQIALKFKVLRGTQPDVEVIQYERTVFLAVTEKTMQYVVPKLQALGYTRDALRFLNLEDPNHHDLRGTEAVMFCKHETGQDGVLREKWDVASGSKALELTPPDPKALRTMDQLFAKARKDAGMVSAPKNVVPAMAGPPLEITDEDVPF